MARTEKKKIGKVRIGVSDVPKNITGLSVKGHGPHKDDLRGPVPPGNHDKRLLVSTFCSLLSSLNLSATAGFNAFLGMLASQKGIIMLIDHRQTPQGIAEDSSYRLNRATPRPAWNFSQRLAHFKQKISSFFLSALQHYVTASAVGVVWLLYLSLDDKDRWQLELFLARKLASDNASIARVDSTLSRLTSAGISCSPRRLASYTAETAAVRERKTADAASLRKEELVSFDN